MHHATTGTLVGSALYLLTEHVFKVPWWALLGGAMLLAGALWLWLRSRARPDGLAAGGRKPGVVTPAAAPQSSGPPLEGLAPELPEPAVVAQLIAALHHQETRAAATEKLAALGDAVLPVLTEKLLLETEELQAQRLTQGGAQVGSPAARQVLITVVQAQNLPARAAALRALGSFAAVPADAPLFQQVVEEEMRLAQHLLHGMVEATPDLRAALRYELRRSLQRLFGLLLQLYTRPPVLAVQRSVAHFANERQSQHWQAMEKLLPRPLYQALYALLSEDRIRQQVQVFDNLLGPLATAESVQTLVVRRGAQAFSTWTLSVALRQWHPQPATVAYLHPHLYSQYLLVQEGAWEVLRRLPVQRPAAHDQLLADYPDVADLLPALPNPGAGIVSARERVLLLKATPLFSETPENVLADMLPVVREVTFQPGQEIFAKGTLDASLFIVGEGEVTVFDGTRQLAMFRKGDFFGELALLDAEARSATAVAHTATVAFQLGQEEFYGVMTTRPEVLHTIMKVLCQRLRLQNEKSRPAAVQHL